MTATSEAGWLIYHKPEFKGRVTDAETKAPIEGAVVVVVYEKHSLISGPGGGYSSVIKVKETLTDKKGEFHFSSYTTLIQPNSVEDYARFIIYKPGYGNFSGHRINPPIGMPLGDIETFFTKETGSRGNVEILVIKDNKSEWKLVNITFGIAELPTLKTREQRLEAIYPADISGAEINEKELPLLYKNIREEYRALGIK
jgi:hypothetical protein